MSETQTQKKISVSSDLDTRLARFEERMAADKYVHDGVDGLRAGMVRFKELIERKEDGS